MDETKERSGNPPTPSATEVAHSTPGENLPGDSEASRPAIRRLSAYTGAYAENTAAFLNAKQQPIAIGISLTYFVVLASLCIGSHYGLRTLYSDLGIMANSIWAFLDGDFLMQKYVDSDPVRVSSRLKAHLNLIFYFISPIYAIFPFAETLLILATAACTLAGLGIYYVGREQLQSSWIALVPMLCFFLSPFTQDANLYGFHAITVSTALLVWSFWAFLREKNYLGTILIFLALLCKEDVALVATFIGTYLLFEKKFRLGAGIVILCVGYFIATTHVIQPRLNSDRKVRMTNGTFKTRYSWIGLTPGEMIKNAVTKPGRVIKHLARKDRVLMSLYLFFVGGIVVALPGWKILPAVMPHIAMGALSDTTWSYRATGTYYWITSGAFIMLAFIVALKKYDKKWGSIATTYLLSVTLLSSLLFAPLPYSKRGRISDFLPLAPTDLRVLEEIQEMIPEDAKVAAQNNVGAHFYNRKFLHILHKGEGEYRIYFLRYLAEHDLCRSLRAHQHHLFGMGAQEIVTDLVKRIRDERWGVILSKRGFFVLKRNGPNTVEKKRALLNVQTYLLDFNSARANHIDSFHSDARNWPELCKHFQ